MPPSPTCDVLVLGSGLAGLRAAWAAAEAAPRARVLLATAARGPSGSSFCNPNARLGFLAPSDDAARETLAARALELTRPGRAVPALANLLMAEAEARLRDLLDLGAPAERDADGRPVRHPACYMPRPREAVQLTDLPRLHALLLARVRALGVELLTGRLCAGLLTDPERGACGAILVPDDGGPPQGVRAGAVVAALGGPAPLFAATLAGGGGTGFSYALLARAGAELVNQGFVQFFWSRADDRSFVRLARLGEPGAALLAPDGRAVPAPRDAAALALSRAGHCPASWGLADAALDRLAASLAAPDGSVGLRLPGEADARILPLAHCGNGGALVDERAGTSVPGLFAAGECASGMHGADRLGGAMAAATQVFGARAGRFAMRHALGSAHCAGSSFNELMKSMAEALRIPPPGRAAPLPAQAGATLLSGNRQSIDLLIDHLESKHECRAGQPPDPALESALTVVRFLHNII